MTVLLAALLDFSSCGKGGADDTGAASGCSHDPPLEYHDFGRGFMEKFCTGCHSSLVPADYRNNAPLGIDFDTYQGIVQTAPLIQGQVFADPPLMPPGGGPSADELAQFKEWMDCQVLSDYNADHPK